MDDFSDKRVVQPFESGKSRYLWIYNTYTNPGGGVISAPGDITFLGENTLQCYWNGAEAIGDNPNQRNFQLYFQDYTLSYPGTPPTGFPYEYNGWHWAAEWCEPFYYPNPNWRAQESPQVNVGKINRFSFWMKLVSDDPPDLQGGGYENWNFGTFTRHTDFSNTEGGSGNAESQYLDKGATRGHFYHKADVGGRSGVWQQFIIDDHPQYQVNSNLDTWGDPGVLTELWTGHPETYFDQLTGFYIDFWRAMNSGSFGEYEWEGTLYLASPRFYQETRAEDTRNIATLNGCYQPGSNTIFAQWQHWYGETPIYDISYKWSTHYSGGFASGTAAPGSPVTAPNSAYLTVDYSTTGISISGHEGGTLYLAIKKQGETNFRELEILLGSLS